ncbi:hypothetical protein PsYK624_125760 [Phanerochaete sordida]|uniref:Uncharacterized protein n=1 Tax=Phanerochaete sordida TaxID=48140 RepID=A0A9P3GJN1_9APHY|nr:hypothetical protein PsYK624_125760 [Phanerochaete sordida]
MGLKPFLTASRDPKIADIVMRDKMTDSWQVPSRFPNAIGKRLEMASCNNVDTSQMGKRMFAALLSRVGSLDMSISSDINNFPGVCLRMSACPLVVRPRGLLLLTMSTIIFSDRHI